MQRAKRRGSVVVVSAPSGSGKSTLIKRLLGADRALLFSVSYTTRPPRQGERNGREYFFVPISRFRKMAASGEFLEWARVFGHYYGTSKRQVASAQARGRDILLDIDVQGHRQVRSRLPEAISIFVLPPSFRELARRLRLRHSDAPDAIGRRLAVARREIRNWPEYDFLVVNDRLPQALRALQAIVQASRFRRLVGEAAARRISKTFGGNEG